MYTFPKYILEITVTGCRDVFTNVFTHVTGLPRLICTTFQVLFDTLHDWHDITSFDSNDG